MLLLCCRKHSYECILQGRSLEKVKAPRSPGVVPPGQLPKEKNNKRIKRKKGNKIMEAIIKGNFVKNDSIKKKDGTVLNVAIVLAGNETVQINNMMFGADVKPLQPVELRVNIKNSQYGLYITPVTNN